MKTVFHNRAKCIGCGQCVSVCPEYWYIAEDGKAALRNSVQKKDVFVGKIDNFDSKLMAKAVEQCPVNIITIQQ
jgi:ferredoxin